MNQDTSKADLVPAPTHCRVAPAREARTRYDVELCRLLHGRLRVVTMIALIPSLLFLGLNLIDPERMGRRDASANLLHQGVTVILAALAGYVWLRDRPTLGELRRAELVLFGSLGVFFAWLQVGVGRRLIELERAEQQVGLDLVRLGIESSAVRWFFLIVVYGVFVPNTWRRCAVVAGATALTPLVLTVVGTGAWREGGGVGLAGWTDLGILMGLAFAVAVFGAHRQSTLQEAEFEAKRLGQYRLGRILGSGGMGEVYEGEHELMRRRCAIKLIRADQAGDRSTLARFEREVQAMARLTHWNTVEVYDFGRAVDGTFYYVMEYVEGMNLEMLVKRYGPVPAGRVIYLMRQVCKALREAHGVGMLHRDIKPSNIMVSRRGGEHDVVKLLDFGLVQRLVPGGMGMRLTSQGAVLGSPEYMAPEQAQGRSDLDARGDVNAVGGVAYYLLTGRPAFERETNMELMMAHSYEEVPEVGVVRAGVPRDVAEVVMRCLRKKREERYGSAEELEAALGKCAGAAEWGEREAEAWWEEMEAGKEEFENAVSVTS